MYEEKEPVILPFAADKKEAAVQCGMYAVLFGGLLALLWGLCFTEITVPERWH